MRYFFTIVLFLGSFAKAEALPKDLVDQADNYRRYLELCISNVQNSDQFCYKSDKTKRELETAGWCPIDGPERSVIFQPCTDYRDIYLNISPDTVKFDFDGIEATLSARLRSLTYSEDGRIHTEKKRYLQISCVKEGSNTISILMNKGVDFHYKTNVEISIGKDALNEGVTFHSLSSSTNPSQSKVSDNYFFIIENITFAKEFIRGMYDEKRILAIFSNEFEDKKMRLGLSGFGRIDKKTLGNMHSFCELFE